MARSTSSKRRKSSVTFKWTKELIIFLSVLAVAIILTIVCLIPTSKERFMKEWNNATTAASATALDEDNVFEYASYKEVQKLISKSGNDPVFILYGSAADGKTAANIQSINETAQDYEIEKIYIFKADFVLEADEDDDDDQDLIESREAYFTDCLDSNDETEVDLNVYCQLWVVQNQKIVFSTQQAIEDKDSVDVDFAKAYKKVVSTYSPIALKKSEEQK